MPGIVVESCDDRPYGPGSSDYAYDKWRQEEMEREMNGKTEAADAPEERAVCTACGHINGAHLSDCEIAALESALEESVKLQSHYAELLNMYDGGKRMTFTATSWLARLKGANHV